MDFFDQEMFPEFKEERNKENKLMCANLHRKLNDLGELAPIPDLVETTDFENPAAVSIDLIDPILRKVIIHKMQDDYRDEHGENAEEGLKTDPVVYYIWKQSEKISLKIIMALKENGLTNMNEFGFFCLNYESLKGIGKWSAGALLELREILTREPDSIREKLKRQSPDGEKGSNREKADGQNR